MGTKLGEVVTYRDKLPPYHLRPSDHVINIRSFDNLIKIYLQFYKTYDH